MSPITLMQQATRRQAVHDAGLRTYMLVIYNYMASALLLTGIVALYVAHSQAALHAMYVIQGNVVVGLKPLALAAMFAPLLVVAILSFGIRHMSLFTAKAIYWLYAALTGLSLSVLFLTFTGQSIARVFFIAAGTFGAMSLCGYTTRRDLTGIGSFVLMGLAGLIIASLVNLFLHSSGLQFAVSAASVLVFTGLTAYDTQRLRQLFSQPFADSHWLQKVAVLGALMLYLHFINLFLNLLLLLGDRRR